MPSKDILGKRGWAGEGLEPYFYEEKGVWVLDFDYPEGLSQSEQVDFEERTIKRAISCMNAMQGVHVDKVGAVRGLLHQARAAYTRMQFAGLSAPSLLDAIGDFEEV